MSTKPWLSPILLIALLAIGTILGLPAWIDGETAVTSLIWLAAVFLSVGVGIGSSPRIGVAAALLLAVASPVLASPVGDGYLPTRIPAPGPETHVVAAGDNFWSIARHRVAESVGRRPANAEVAAYWWDLVDSNRDSIRSHDPDLIFPGEVVSLP